MVMAVMALDIVWLRLRMWLRLLLLPRFRRLRWLFPLVLLILLVPRLLVRSIMQITATADVFFFYEWLLLQSVTATLPNMFAFVGSLPSPQSPCIHLLGRVRWQTI